MVDNFRPEVHSDFISGVVVDPTDVKVRVKLVSLGQTVLEIYDCLTLLERQRRRLRRRRPTDPMTIGQNAYWRFA